MVTGLISVQGEGNLRSFTEIAGKYQSWIFSWLEGTGIREDFVYSIRFSQQKKVAIKKVLIMLTLHPIRSPSRTKHQKVNNISYNSF